jgi:hypothetical protein
MLLSVCKWINLSTLSFDKPSVVIYMLLTNKYIFTETVEIKFSLSTINSIETLIMFENVFVSVGINEAGTGNSSHF